MTAKRLALTLVVVALVLASGCGCRPPLGEGEKAGLDTLSAEEVVVAYMSSSNPEVKLYLSAPIAQQRLAHPDTYEKERAGGVVDIVIERGLSDPATLADGYRDVRTYEVTYRVHGTYRDCHVAVGRDPAKAVWRVLLADTLPPGWSW